ncbi:hypothetical protein BJV82DRAFT_155981 [Fennellomyces sp. T-0311]|nr:hypothetical protein BJV82DRAFT_155981 [Fennellomyces sp. T-0311]
MFQRLHKKSASCTALPIPSASSSISTRSQPPAFTRSHQDDIGDVHSGRTTSHSGSSSSSSSIRSNRSNDHNWTKAPSPGLEENTTVRSGLSSLLKHKTSPFPLPSLCIFSREALQNEYSEHQQIVPYVYPSTIPIDQISTLVSVLETLFRTMNEVVLDEEDKLGDDDDGESCRIIGLGTFKVATWNMTAAYAGHNLDDMTLVVILSTQFPDRVISEHMKTLQDDFSRWLVDKM